MDIGRTIMSLEGADMFSTVAKSVKKERESTEWENVHLTESDIRYCKKMEQIMASSMMSTVQLPYA